MAAALLGGWTAVAHAARGQGAGTPVATPEVVSPYFSVSKVTLPDGQSLSAYIINGPPQPPPGYELQRAAVALPAARSAATVDALTAPAYNWVFGCSSVSGAMILGYYDRNGYPNMYTGPTNGGVAPLNNSSWPTWSDGYETYPNLPLAASHQGVDGRTTRGSIDDYWVSYLSSASDPYITGSWTQHAWSDAIGDYMKTSQSAYGNTDGSTIFYNYPSTQLTCADMPYLTDKGKAIDQLDGTYGRKLFYEARGYTVTDCFNQNTDNNNGGFTFALYKAQIDAGHPVMLNLKGHTIVGVGYDSSTNTIYIHDTWDYSDHTMTWGGSYTGMQLLSVSIVNLATPACRALTLSHTGQGSDPVASPTNTTGCASGQYRRGEKITLTASPATDWAVGGWTGTDNDASTATTNTFSMPDAASTVSVAYAGTCHTLTRAHSGQGSDPTASPASSTGCTSGKYTQGESITLTASPATGWQVSSWTSTNNDASTATSNALTMPAAAVTTTVAYIQSCYALTLSHSGQGSDPVASPAYSTGCASGQYHAGASVALTAAPATAWEVGGWTGTNSDTSTAQTNTFTMPAAAGSASVTYVQSCYLLTRSHTGQGSDPTASPASSTGCASGRYHAGQSVSLTAGPATGWETSGWTGTANDASTAATNSLTMTTTASTVSVAYIQTCYALTRSHTGQGADPVASPTYSTGCASGQYHMGESIGLTASPAPGWWLATWTGTDDDTSAAVTNTLTMPAAAAAVAVDYTQSCYRLTRSHTGQGSDPVASPAYSTGCASGQYQAGESIVLTAGPAVGWTVGGWTGTAADASAAVTNTLTMTTAAATTSVAYTHVCYALTLSHSGQGGDPMASPAGSTGCASGKYYYGETVALAATPDTGWGVGSWTGTELDASTAVTNTLTMPAEAVTSAVAYSHLCYPLELAHEGSGADPAASPTGSTGCDSGKYYYREPITLTASPAAAWHLGGWAGTDDDTRTALTNTLSMPAASRTITATYAHNCYPLARAHTGEGSDPAAEPARSAACASGQYYAGEAVTLTASPALGWEVGAWAGTDDDNRTTMTGTLTMPATAMTTTVTYAHTCYTLTLSHTGQGADPVASPTHSTGCDSGKFHFSQAITLTASPAAGWQVGAWTGGGLESSSGISGTLTMPAASSSVSVRYVLPVYLPLVER